MKKLTTITIMLLIAFATKGQTYFRVADSEDIVLKGYLDTASLKYLPDSNTVNLWKLMSGPDTIKGILTFYIEETPYLQPVRAEGYVVVKRWEGVVFVWVEDLWWHEKVFHRKGFELDKDRYYEFIPFKTLFQKVK